MHDQCTGMSHNASIHHCVIEVHYCGKDILHCILLSKIAVFIITPVPTVYKQDFGIH